MARNGGKVDIGRLPASVFTTNPYENAISPLVALQSDKSDLIGFRLLDFITLFGERILPVVLRVCEEKGQYLDEGLSQG
jgi:hypothetical protein